MSNLEKLYTVGEAAEALRVSKHTIAQYLSRGVLMRTKCGTKTLIRESQLVGLLKDNGKSRIPVSVLQGRDTSPHRAK